MCVNTTIIKKLLATLAAIAVSATVHADSWAPPMQCIISSSNGNYMLEITPDKAGTYARDEIKPCEATFFGKLPGESKKNKPQIFLKISNFTLLNARAPAVALVSDDGKYIVTSDDWFDVGNGKNVIVIYTSDGTLIKRLSLADIASPAEIESMTQSTASKHWHGDIKFDAECKSLKVEIQSTGSQLNKNAKNREASIELSTGVVTPKPGT